MARYGAALKMWKLDYDNPSLGYVHSEARPGLYMYRCHGCRVFGLTVTASGGDGMEIVWVKDVHVAGVTLDDNYRQGMSVVGALDLLVENSTFSNTGGPGCLLFNSFRRRLVYFSIVVIFHTKYTTPRLSDFNLCA
jgi:hypothetical protein